MDCLGAPETFIHTNSPDLPPLVKAALVHVQFEAIHLFLYGSGHARIEQLGRPAATALRVYQFLQRRGLTTIPKSSWYPGLSQPTITSAVAHLWKLDIVRETTGRRRGKVFVYGAFLDLLSEGTHPLPR